LRSNSAIAIICIYNIT